MIDISGLDKAEVLHALWCAASPQGLVAQFVQADPKLGDQINDSGADIEPFEDAIAEAEKRAAEGTFPAAQRIYFDYFLGHPIKVDLTGDEFDPGLFDRDAGQGAAERAIEALRAEK